MGFCIFAVAGVGDDFVVLSEGGGGDLLFVGLGLGLAGAFGSGSGNGSENGL